MVELNAPDTRTVTCGQSEARDMSRILAQAEMVDIAGNLGYEPKSFEWIFSLSSPVSW